MNRSEVEYLERRAEEARIAAAANDGVVREIHEKFATAYAERAAKAGMNQVNSDQASC